MKKHLLFLFAATTAAASPPSAHLGLELWSLRAQFRESVPGGLADAKGFGFRIVETAGTYGLSAADFRGRLDANGLKAVAAHVDYSMMDKDAAAAIAQAKALGVEYVVVPGIPHPALGFTTDGARAAAAKFNAWGAAAKAAGMKFGYHLHGFEFVADRSGETPFDVLARSTNPDLVSFEMDVFWVAHAGVDPVALLKKYPGRWRMLHLKDLRKGAETNATGHAPAQDDVPVGQGRVDWPEVFKEAKKQGLDYYFIEDESPTPLKNIPQSLKYLEAFDL